MLRVVHSSTECEVAGSSAELKAIADTLRSMARIGGEQIVACDAQFDPQPWPNRLRALVLTRKEDKDCVTVAGGVLIITGSSNGLDRFASFFDMPADSPDGYHVHHEACYTPDLIASDSFPLIVTVRR